MHAVEQSQCSANYAGRREQLGVAPGRIGKTRRVAKLTLRNTHSHCTLHAHKSPADSRRALETRAGHRATALQCRTKADHGWRSPCWPLFSSTHSTACSSPSPIAHRRCCYTTTVAKDPLASESAQGGRILAGCVSVVSQAP